MDADAIMAQIDGFSSSLGTSMQRDVEAGRPSELDAIAGAVVRAGRRHGIACPITEGLMAQILVAR
jgi:2-dehydropantoate 2-reductase